MLMMERLRSSYFFQDGQEDMARMGQGFATVVTDFTVHTVHLPAVQDDLPLPSSSARASSHTEHQETAAARASAFLRRKQTAVAKGSQSSAPQHAPSWGWGLNFSPAWPLDHTSLACHLLATCHLCTC